MPRQDQAGISRQRQLDGLGTLGHGLGQPHHTLGTGCRHITHQRVGDGRRLLLASRPLAHHPRTDALMATAYPDPVGGMTRLEVTAQGSNDGAGIATSACAVSSCHGTVG